MMNILGTRIDSVSYISVRDQVMRWTQSDNAHYICVANVQTVMEAYDSIEFGKAINDSSLVTPDGMPLVWMMRAKGVPQQERVYGPTLMLYLLQSAASEGIPVGFYGGTPNVLKLLIKRMQAYYNGLNIVYCYSPPFREMSPKEDTEIVEQINQSGVKLLFVGLGCPKQETWMALHRDRMRAVMIGVGAAFDFHAGTKPQAPAWMQNAGLEWLFRLSTEPRRLWKRYLYHNPRFVVIAIADLLGLLQKAG
jgi:N-acetylglucosaminyldiphosphoundecaprenol N-acetyl-beta-D-mannosaminyltransferase